MMDGQVYFKYLDENRALKLVKIILSRGRGMRQNDGEANPST
jgi:hypothetical protein